MPALSTQTLESLKAAAGDGGWIEDAENKAPYLTDERGLYHGDAALVLRPKTTARVAEIVTICAEHAVGIVPQGGNTGYCGGSIPDESGQEVVLSLSRMNAIREVDAVNNTLIAEAGCVLNHIQAAAEDAGRLFPLSLGAEGSCQIGGNLSTNAGGVQVLRYGNTRDLVLGLEVVLADGRILEGLRGLRKDNTGYDLKQLFLGSEGTLGIITATVLKLYPRPADVTTVFAAVSGAQGAAALLNRLRGATGDGVTTFEYFNRACMDLVLEHIDGARDPFQAPHGDYALIELSSGRESAEAALAEALEAGEALDAVVAESGRQADDLWRLRETIPEAQKRAGGSIKHDVSVPVSKIPEFLGLAEAKSLEIIPDARLITFGHMGDGNIHYNLSPAPNGNAQDFLGNAETLCPAIHDIAVGLGGSFSAEHGVGVLKKPELEKYKSGVELDLMRTIKRTLDPKGIMNPGKVVGGG
jgi:D-lactate dehydrogenase (cytochrome)